MESQTSSSDQLPLVDFTDANLKPGTEAWLSGCHVVRTALEDHGCFVARYDNVGPQLCNNVVSAMGQVFGLPLDTKRKNTSDIPFHSYYGQISFLPLYESFGIEDPLNIDGCQKFTNLMWPEGNDSFNETINEYSKRVAELEHVVKRMIFESYGVDMKLCDALIESSNYLLRCLQYRTPQMGESDLGMHSHTDVTFLSVLHQVNNVGGLEIKLKNGEWSEVADSSPSLFVVMAGDAFKVWSNGRIVSCEHRVMMNTTKKTRYCMGLFTFKRGTVNVPEELVDEEHPLLYKTFDNYGYLRFFDKEKIKDSDQRIKVYCGV